VSGTLESYDAAGKTLTVKGSNSTWTFDAAGARVWEGSKSVGLEELSSHTGAKVTVKYTEHGGQKAASSVRLASAHVKSAAKSK
jgi:phage baseplate assembly protein gpV